MLGDLLHCNFYLECSRIEVNDLDTERKFDLIVTIVNRGFADEVMNAARAAGAHGGTILWARGSGVHETEKFFGISIQPEKELVLILVRHGEKKEIMQAIGREAGLTKEGKGMSFSLPVDDVVGIVHMMNDLKDK